MPLYLAYQIDLENLSDSKLIKIMDDYFDFSFRTSVKDTRSFIESRRIMMEKNEKEANYWKQKFGIKDIDKIVHLAFSYVYDHYMKNHPLLEIRFCYKRELGNDPTTQDFIGLNIHAHHSGSEGIVDMINFKPEMDAYLHSIGMDYKDRSKLSLD